MTLSMTTKELTAEVERLDKAATAGPWCSRHDEYYDTYSVEADDVVCDLFRLSEETHRRRPFDDDHARTNSDLIARFRTLAPELACRLAEAESRPVLTDEVVGLAREIVRDDYISISGELTQIEVEDYRKAMATCGVRLASAILTLSTKGELGKETETVKPYEPVICKQDQSVDPVVLTLNPPDARFEDEYPPVDVPPPPAPAVTREEVDWKCSAMWYWLGSVRNPDPHDDVLNDVEQMTRRLLAERDAAVNAAKDATERAERAEKDKAHTAEKSQHWYAECGRLAYELRQAEASALRFKDEAVEHAGLSDQLKSRISALEAELIAAKGGSTHE